MFTGTAIMTLIDAGELALTDLAGTILPSLPAPWHDITIYHLLTHTSGLPDFTDPVQGTFIADTRDEVVRLLAAQPLLGRPGESWRYNQTGYMLRGMIIETITAQPFDTFLTQRLLRPLGMSATCFGDYKQLFLVEPRCIPVWNYAIAPLSPAPINSGHFSTAVRPTPIRVRGSIPRLAICWHGMPHCRVAASCRESA